MKDSGITQQALQHDNHTQVLGGSPISLDPTPGLLPVGTRLHEFEITGLIGEGGFGVVYLAQDHQLQRRVALKEYLPTTLAVRGHGQGVTLRSQRHAETFAKGLQSFINEARLLARFDHPALVKVHRFWEANGTAYLVMPYYEGPTLKAARLAMAEPPDEDWIRRLLAPLLDALESIHEQGCLHRDIAPDNILLVDGRPVLLDFGAARQVISDTQALTVILKPGYAPVEQYAEMPGSRQGPWTDLYALGAVVHFLVSGQAPPPSVGRMMQDPRVALAGAAGRYPTSWLEAIDRCLAVRVEDRPQSVAQLRELLEPPRQPAPAGSPVDRPDAAPARGLRRAHTVGAALIMAGLLGGWLLNNREPGAAAAPAMAANGGAAAEAVTAPVRHDLESAWLAVAQAASPDHGLTVSGLRNPLRIGRDSLELELRSARDGWVYLLLWDRASGQVGLLLPNEADREHRIEAGQVLTLPRPGWHYVADAPAGAWELLLIVSESPREFPALDLQPDSAMRTASREHIEQSLASGLAALAGLPQCGAGASCSPAYGALRLTLQEVDAP